MKDWAWKEMKRAERLHLQVRAGLAELCERLHDQPQTAFSVAAGHAGRQVFHRLSRREPMDVDTLLQGHFAQTAHRCAAYPQVLVVQDTTEIGFTRKLPAAGTKGLRVPRLVRQCFGHAALALSPDGVPLGLLHLHFWQRSKQGGARLPRTEAQKQGQRRGQRAQAKESRKWGLGLRSVEARLPPDPPTLVIQDREGDVFAFLAAPRRPNTHLLVRAAQDRNVAVSLADPEGSPSAAPRIEPASSGLLELAASFPPGGEQRIQVPAAKPGEEREAVLTLRYGPVWLLPPLHRHRDDPSLPQPVWVVHAEETTPPPGEERICWVLLCTQPIESVAAAQEMLRCYGLRWRIERLHYVLKSGLEIERLQHDEERLPLVLGLYYLVAWQILRCLYLGRQEPELPATAVLEREEVQVLAAATRQEVRNAGAVVMALARLGGYVQYRSAKPPGLKRIWQGCRRLQDLVAGARLRLDGCNHYPGFT